VDGISIRRLDRISETEIAMLAAVLVDCVETDASVGFMPGMTIEAAQHFWWSVAAAVKRGERVVLVAEDADGIVGTVQLVSASMPNQTHRADVAKMLVHTRGRRRGIGTALMQAVEATARASGKTLLVLDTETGGDADRLYTRLGWIRVGDVPDYALAPRGGYLSTTFFYRRL
jgi:GNAT superfamily N-acetyltransferase